MSEKEEKITWGKFVEAGQQTNNSLQVILKYGNQNANELEALRLAVCEYFNSSSPELSNAVVLGPFPNEARGGIKLALSAGIHFENGTWILKEGQ